MGKLKISDDETLGHFIYYLMYDKKVCVNSEYTKRICLQTK